jgi:hypothetical protein
MKALVLATLVWTAGLSVSLATPREDLLFDLNAALKTRDGAGFARCFNFQGADEPTRQSFVKIISEILAWPTFDLRMTDRREAAPAVFEENGRKVRLNGDWLYQIHIFLSKSTDKGFVFPAGRCADGKDRILVAIPAEAVASPTP